MKRMNDEELIQYMKKALEKPPSVEPLRSTDEMWRKIKEKEKRTKRIDRLRKIPMYASSFIAVVAVTFLLVRLPETSDQLTNQKEKQMAEIDRVYEEIQIATSIQKDEELDTTSKSILESFLISYYPTYLPAGYSLTREEFVENGRILYYEKEENVLVIETYYAEKAPQVAMERRIVEMNYAEKQVDSALFRITGKLAEEELQKIIESMD